MTDKTPPQQGTDSHHPPDRMPQYSCSCAAPNGILHDVGCISHEPSDRAEPFRKVEHRGRRVPGHLYVVSLSNGGYYVYSDPQHAELAVARYKGRLLHRYALAHPAPDTQVAPSIFDTSGSAEGRAALRYDKAPGPCESASNGVAASQLVAGIESGPLTPTASTPAKVTSGPSQEGAAGSDATLSAQVAPSPPPSGWMTEADGDVLRTRVLAHDFYPDKSINEGLPACVQEACAEDVAVRSPDKGGAAANAAATRAGLRQANPAPSPPPQVAPDSLVARRWKCGDEFVPYHPSASHVEPGYRDGWNACYKAAESRLEQLQREREQAREDCASAGAATETYRVREQKRATECDNLRKDLADARSRLERVTQAADAMRPIAESAVSKWGLPGREAIKAYDAIRAEKDG